MNVMFAKPQSSHKHPIRGDASMETKKLIIENTTIYIHSPLVNMSNEEKEKWVEEERIKKNPIIAEIDAAINACYQN